MNIPLQIGITGGIGAGKSIICRIFRVLSIPVYDADIRAKDLMNTLPEIRTRVIELFGKESYSKNEINRKHIGKIAFHQPGKIEELNKLVHPYVARDYENWVIQNGNSRYVLKEAALLFEAGSYKVLDRLITVTAPESLRIKRVLQRDPHRNESDVRAIISNQWTEEQKVEKSDFVILNDESKMVIPQVLDIHSILMR